MAEVDKTMEQLSHQQIELVKQLRTANGVGNIASTLAKLMHSCGIYNFQQVGLELARISVTSGLGRN